MNILYIIIFFCSSIWSLAFASDLLERCKPSLRTLSKNAVPNTMTVVGRQEKVKPNEIVKFSRNFERSFERLPQYFRDKVIDWTTLVENTGLREVRKRPGFHDEPLIGSRKGQRSVRINQDYRIIYSVSEDGKEILMLEVSKHEY